MWKALLLYLLTYSSATTPTISALMNPHVCEFSLHDRPGVEIATSRRATQACNPIEPAAKLFVARRVGSRALAG